MKSERTERYTRSDLPAGRIDRERVLGMTAAEIEAFAREDEGDQLATGEELAGGQLVFPSDRNKVPVYIRLDAEVVAFYKAGGPGYQTRINQDLRDAVRRRKRQYARRISSRPTPVIRQPAKAGVVNWEGQPQVITVTGDRNAA